MTPATRNLECIAGDGYSHTLTILDSDGTTPLDMSSYIWTAQVRRSYKATEAEDFTIDVTGAATGVIVIRLTGTQTRALLGGNVYDVQYQLVADGDPVTIQHGTFVVSPDVTREEVAP